MRPEDLLTTLAQLGVAVAGFSGIVVVLARPARDESPASRSMLSVLLWGSLGVVLWSLAPLVLLSAHVSERSTWVVSSAGWSIQQTLALARRAYQIRYSPEKVPALGFVVPLSLGGLSALALQIANVAWLGAAWPHLAGLVWWLVISLVFFLRLMET